MEIDRTLFMMAFGRDVDYQGRHRKVCTQNCPSEGGGYDVTRGKNGSLWGMSADFGPRNSVRSSPPERQPRPFVPVVPYSPASLRPGSL